MTSPHTTRASEPGRIDGALRQTVALLELVRREDEVMRRLLACVSELEAISSARVVLLDRTDAEVAEAGCLVAGSADPGAGAGS